MRDLYRISVYTLIGPPVPLVASLVTVGALVTASKLCQLPTLLHVIVDSELCFLLLTVIIIGLFLLRKNYSKRKTRKIVLFFIQHQLHG